MKTDWKQIASNLAAQHNEYGAGLVPVNPDAFLGTDPSGVLVNTTKDGQLLAVSGEELTPRKIRKWTWELRKARILNRKTSVLWSVIEDGTSYVGTGAYTNPKAAEAFEARDADQT